MAQVQVLPPGTYPIGTRTLGPVAVPQGVTLALLQLDGAAMTDPALSLTIQLDFSLDGGTTWASTNRGRTTDPFPVTLTTNGGALNRQGTALALYPLGVNDIPSPTSTTRSIKAVVTIAGTPLTTSATLTLL